MAAKTATSKTRRVKDWNMTSQETNTAELGCKCCTSPPLTFATNQTTKLSNVASNETSSAVSTNSKPAYFTRVRCAVATSRVIRYKIKYLREAEGSLVQAGREVYPHAHWRGEG